MSTEQSILVVDDAKFSAAIVTKKLKIAGFNDIRTVHHAHDAIALHKERPVDLLVADWLMPEMDGISLCASINDLNTDKHYTYCLLITAKEGDQALSEALSSGLDDFILKSEINAQLVPRVIAGLRTAKSFSCFISKQRDLAQQIEKLQSESSRDAVTGLGNRTHAEEALARTFNHTQARGGATSYMTVKVANWNQIRSEYRDLVCTELSQQIANKLKSLVRPLDEVCSLSTDELSVIAHFKDSNDCNLSTYRRIHQGLDKQAFKTSAGFIAVSVSCAICFIDQETQSAQLEQLISFNKAQIENCESRKSFAVAPWQHVG